MQESEELKRLRMEEEKQKALEKAKKQAILLAKIRYQQAQQKWVDSVFNTLTLQQKVGQLFMVSAYSNKDETHYQEIERLIKEHFIGGLIFFQGGPLRQAILTNRYQQAAKVPLIIGIDAEWGLAMRLDSTMSFPKQITLGAIQENTLIYQMGVEIGKQCKRLGIHVNFAPSVDVNNNPNNPVINFRSFGENKENVAQKGLAYMRGMQDVHVMGCGKHFPGHGDTDQDSHHTLPIILHNQERISQLELYPFKKLIADSLASVMVAHLHIPALDSTENRPTTLSPYVVQTLLQDSLKFEGLIFTDAMNMQGVAKNFKAGEADVAALKAGNDVILYPMDVKAGIKAIIKAIQDSVFTESYIDAKVKKVLKAKYFVGLHQKPKIALEKLEEDLKSIEAQSLKEKLYEKAITLVRDDSSQIPIVRLDSTSFASVAIGTKAKNTFDIYLNKYTKFEQHVIESSASKANFQQLIQKLKKKNFVVVSFHGMNQDRKQNYGISAQAVEFVENLQQHTRVIVVVFGNPYSLKNFEKIRHLICGYEKDDLAQRASAQLIFGAIGCDGKLPVSASPLYSEGTGIIAKPIGRMGYALPENVGMSSEVLKEIDKIAEYAIEIGATPGCQVVIARYGKIVYQKSFGYHTYNKYGEQVTDSSIYDIASLTKVLGTLPALMRLVEDNKLDFSKKVKDYLPDTDTTNKGDLLLQDIAVHQSGLKAYVTYWNNIIRKTSLGFTYNPDYVRDLPTEGFNIEIIPKRLYANNQIQEYMWKWTLASGLLSKKRSHGKYAYWYSDIGFYIFKRIIEQQIKIPMRVFLEDKIYSPLGLQTMTYLPLEKFSINRIAPTEMDTDFRRALIHGTVHDPGAALYGGVAGHAGLFSNAHDVAIIMQMFLQNGYYGGKQYYKPKTIEFFNTRPNEKYENKRGLIWDKPPGAASKFASEKTFGHTGFTGTCAWADPEKGLVYVFLSNRIYPYALNKKLIKEEIRRRIHDVAYKSIAVKSEVVWSKK
ncbi:MAG: glycoside hydrolase family 3 N-terminal domain-containing protein [Flammeovirgaceae bacterium]